MCGVPRAVPCTAGRCAARPPAPLEDGASQGSRGQPPGCSRPGQALHPFPALPPRPGPAHAGPEDRPMRLGLNPVSPEVSAFAAGSPAQTVLHSPHPPALSREPFSTPGHQLPSGPRPGEDFSPLVTCTDPSPATLAAQKPSTFICLWTGSPRGLWSTQSSGPRGGGTGVPLPGPCGRGRGRGSRLPLLGSPRQGCCGEPGPSVAGSLRGGLAAGRHPPDLLPALAWAPEQVAPWVSQPAWPPDQVRLLWAAPVPTRTPQHLV